MPTSSTIWLKIGNADVRVLKQRVGNALLIKIPDIVQQVNGERVRFERTASECHWEQVGTGKTLQVQTILKDEKGNDVSLAQAICIVEHTRNLALNKNAEQVDKKLIQDHVVNSDGSIGEQVAPYPPTDKIEIKETPEDVSDQGDAYWVSSTMMEDFLITEEYGLPAADPRNDIKLWKEAEAALKRDEVAVTTYSNGGFTQYFAFLVPYMKDGKFTWLLRISDKKADHTACLRDIPGVKVPIQAVKTLQTLPPIQALLTVPTAKKKK
jgi:hypothetical protein